MEIEIQITRQPIVVESPGKQTGDVGAFAEFAGTVRGLENGQAISAIEYEAYSPMAENQMRSILESLSEKHPCLSARVIHRIGAIPVGETAIYVGITAKHRAEAFAMLAGFMDRLKQDVPIWKGRTINSAGDEVARLKSNVPPPPVKQKLESPHVVSYKSVDEALVEISTRC